MFDLEAFQRQKSLHLIDIIHIEKWRPLEALEVSGGISTNPVYTMNMFYIYISIYYLLYTVVKFGFLNSRKYSDPSSGYIIFDLVYVISFKKREVTQKQKNNYLVRYTLFENRFTLVFVSVFDQTKTYSRYIIFDILVLIDWLYLVIYLIK